MFAVGDSSGVTLIVAGSEGSDNELTEAWRIVMASVSEAIVHGFQFGDGCGMLL